MFYKRLCKTLNDKGILIASTDNPNNYVDDKELDYYISFYEYNEKQYEKFKKDGSIAGIKDVSTTCLIWDFDNDDVENSKVDAYSICTRLISHGIDQKDIRIYFSGKKGFHVSIDIDRRLNVQECKNICFALANGLMFDKVIYNSNRIIRLKGTKHQDTGLYKYPLTFSQLGSLNIEDIYGLAKDLNNINGDNFNAELVLLPDSIYKLRLKLATEIEEKPIRNILETKDLDWKLRPKWLSNCKYALQNGFFEQGTRSNALTCLAATYKNSGFDQEITYRMLKGVCEIQSKRNKVERFSDDELFNNIICQVFGPHWENGQYSCKDDGWLKDYCLSLGEHKCNHDTDKELIPSKFIDIHGSFKDYVLHIDQNTISSGLPSLDKALFMSTGSNILLLGSSGSGKTSVALNILENTSKMGVKSVFCSLDMARNRMFEKVCYKLTGLPREKLYQMFAENKEGPLMEELTEKYGNVHFMSKSCPTVKDIRDYIIRCQEKDGERVKLVMVDYFERVTSEFSDEVISSKRIAGELQNLVNDLDICLITLVQPNKASLNNGIDDPLYSYVNIKGSSFIYQSARQILSLWRDFYSPHDFSRDKYMRMAILKNDLGELSTLGFTWNGKRGEIGELDDRDKTELEQWLKEKEEKNNHDDGWNKGGSKKKSW